MITTISRSERDAISRTSISRTSISRMSISLRRSILLLAFALTVPLGIGCHSATEQSPPVVVNSPASGVVRRVLVDEGASVDKDAAIIEIALQPAPSMTPQPPKPNAGQTQAERDAQANVASSEAEVNRTSAELQRIEPLVKRGLASKAELEKARTQSLDAQERLKIAREKAHNAEVNRNQQTSITPSIAPVEEIVTVRVPSAGKIRKFSIEAGQQVVAGQPLATLVSHT